MPRAPGRRAGAWVLHIGCGAGSHLLALAACSPNNEFVGIDFSRPGIAGSHSRADIDARAARSGVAQPSFVEVLHRAGCLVSVQGPTRGLNGWRVSDER